MIWLARLWLHVELIGRVRRRSDRKIISRWKDAHVELSGVFATSEKWCLTLSVAMDTCSSEGCAPSHLACYERHVGHSYVHLWINIYLYSQFGIKTCECKTNRTQTSLPSPSPGCLKYLFSCWMPAGGGRCCWGVRGAGCRAAGGLMGLWQVQLPL